MSIGKIVTLKSYEKEIFRVRPHIITFLPGFSLYLLAVAILVGAVLYFFTTMGDDLLTSIYAPLIVLGGAVYILSINLFFFAYFIDFYLDILFITNDRLVDIEQNNLFARTISEVDLYRVQDVTSEVKGFLAHFFNYGNLTIQTAGTEQKFVMHNVPDPHGLRQKLLDLADTDRKYHQEVK